MLNIMVEGRILLLLTQGSTEKLRQEEGEGGFDGGEGQVGVVIIGPHIDRTGHFATVGTEVSTKLHHRKRLPEGHATHGTLGT